MNKTVIEKIKYKTVELFDIVGDFRIDISYDIADIKPHKGKYKLSEKQKEKKKYLRKVYAKLTKYYDTLTNISDELDTLL